MKRTRRFLTAILSLMLVFQIFPVVALAYSNETEMESSVWNMEDLGLTLEVEYSMKGDTIIERSTLHDDVDVFWTLRKEISPDGIVQVFEDEVLVNTFTGNYSVFLNAAYGDTNYEAVTEIVPSSDVYFPCGFNVYHQYNGNFEETIDVSVSNSAKQLTAFIAKKMASAFGTGAEKLTAIASQIAIAIGDPNCDYIDMSGTEYFITDNSGQNLNCIHMYLVFYDMVGGKKQITKTQWKFYQATI